MSSDLIQQQPVNSLRAVGLAMVHSIEDEQTFFAHDGYRTYPMATRHGQKTFEIRNHTDYPPETAHLFSALPTSRRSRMDMTQLCELWQQLGNMVEDLSYPRELTAPAMVLYHEGRMMGEVHSNRRVYTVLDCLKLITCWRPAFTFEQLGILIDRNVSVESILALPQPLPFMYVNALYPTTVETD